MDLINSVTKSALFKHTETIILISVLNSAHWDISQIILVECAKNAYSTA